MWHDRPTDTARRLWDSDYRKAWPHPLVLWLRERSIAGALDWVLHITGELLPRSGSDHSVELEAELDVLRCWRASPPSVMAFRQKADALCFRPGGDNACDALSVLCGDMAAAMCPGLEVGYDWLWPVPSLLCGTFYKGVPRPELVEWCLADFDASAAGVV